MTGEKFCWWEKFCIKCFGIILVRDVSEATRVEHGESLMALHFCTTCKEYQVATYFDPLSKKGRIVCVCCHSRQIVDDFFGMSLFRIDECTKTARCVYGRRKKEKKKWNSETFLFLKFFLFGLGAEAPDDRRGRTISDLELEARDLFLFSLSWYCKASVD